MNIDIKQNIDAELPPGSAPGKLDVDTVMRSSRSRRTKRRLAGGGAVLASIVTVTAIVLSVMTLAPSGTDADTGKNDAAAERDEPQLDPDTTYSWDGVFPAKADDTTKAYTSAFWDYLLENHPEATYLMSNDSGNYEEVTGDHAKTGFFMSHNNKLYEGDIMDDPSSIYDKDPVRERKQFSLFERFEPGTDADESDGTSCCGLSFRLDGEKPEVSLNVEILPADSFTKGTEDALDPAWCGDGGEKLECETEVVTGPNGEEVWNMTSSVKTNEHPFGRDTVVYREDGSAVVVELSSSAEGTKPMTEYFQHDDLLAIALALPGDPIA